MEFDQEKIEAAIIKQTSEALVDNDNLYEKAKRAIDERINKIFTETVDAQIAKKVESAVHEGFSAQYTKVDNLGRPVGAPTTIGDELSQMIASYWSERVDSKGKPTSSDRYSNPPTTRAEWMMAQLCAEDFTKELKQVAVNVTAGLKDGLRAELRGAVDTVLGQIIPVQSAEDKAEGRSR